MRVYPYAIASAAVLGTAAILVGSGVSAQPVKVTAEQLLINQRISQAAVKRSNSALNYLAPVRTTASDAANTGAQGVTPLSRVAGAGQGWPTSAIADTAITQAKIANNAVGTAQLAHPTYTAVVNGAGALVRGVGASGSVTPSAGVYTVTFGANVSACAFTATIGSPDGPPADPGFITAQPAVGNANAATVTTFDATPAVTADARPFHLAVHC